MANVPVAGVVVGVLAAILWAACGFLSYWYSRSKTRVAPSKVVIGKNTGGDVVFVGTAPPTRNRQDRLDPTGLVQPKRESLSVVPARDGRQGGRRAEGAPLISRQGRRSGMPEERQRDHQNGSRGGARASAPGEHQQESQGTPQRESLGGDGGRSSEHELLQQSQA